MECPRCGSPASRVIKSSAKTIRIVRLSERDVPDAGRRLRFRRRECLHCKTRYTTREETLGGSLDETGRNAHNPPTEDAA